MHADLACGIGGFTVAAQSPGAATTWACDINRTAVDAYNAAHGHIHACPAECHPIEQEGTVEQARGYGCNIGWFPLPGLQ